MEGVRFLAQAECERDRGSGPCSVILIQAGTCSVSSSRKAGEANPQCLTRVIFNLYSLRLGSEMSWEHWVGPEQNWA